MAEILQNMNANSWKSDFQIQIVWLTGSSAQIFLPPIPNAQYPYILFLPTLQLYEVTVIIVIIDIWKKKYQRE